jgi:hypothetical protein
MQICRWHRYLVIMLIPSEPEALPLAVTTLVLIFPVIWSFSDSPFVELLTKFMKLLHIFLFTDFLVCLSLSRPHCGSWRSGWRNGLQTWNILNKQSGQKSNGGPAALFLEEVLTNSQIKWSQCTVIYFIGVVRALHKVVMKLWLLYSVENSWLPQGLVTWLV